MSAPLILLDPAQKRLVLQPTIDRLIRLLGEETLDETNDVLAMAGQSLKRVYPFERVCGPDVDLFPCYMLGNPTLTRTWIASDDMVGNLINIPVMGYMLFDADNQDDVQPALLAWGEHALSIFDRFENGILQLDNGLDLTFPEGDVPAPTIKFEYEITGDDQAFLRMFTIDWSGLIDKQLNG